jgi:hypothetical protein
MEAEATFVARAITEGPLDDTSCHVAWGDDATDPEHLLIVMRNDDPSPGEASYCVVQHDVEAVDVDALRSAVRRVMAGA